MAEMCFARGRDAEEALRPLRCPLWPLRLSLLQNRSASSALATGGFAVICLRVGFFCPAFRLRILANPKDEAEG
jgi:hypothetical protein